IDAMNASGPEERGNNMPGDIGSAQRAGIVQENPSILGLQNAAAAMADGQECKSEIINGRPGIVVPDSQSEPQGTASHRPLPPLAQPRYAEGGENQAIKAPQPPDRQIAYVEVAERHALGRTND